VAGAWYEHWPPPTAHSLSSSLVSCTTALWGLVGCMDGEGEAEAELGVALSRAFSVSVSNWM